MTQGLNNIMSQLKNKRRKQHHIVSVSFLLLRFQIKNPRTELQQKFKLAPKIRKNLANFGEHQTIVKRYVNQKRRIE